MFRNLARASPASWAVMSKATPTRAASWVKRTSSPKGMPAWPAAAAIWVSSAALMGMVRVRARSSRCRACRAGRGASTTFLTSAKASSKRMAAPVARTRGAARAAPAAVREAAVCRRSRAAPARRVALSMAWMRAATAPAGPETRSASSIRTWRRKRAPVSI